MIVILILLLLGAQFISPQSSFADQTGWNCKALSDQDELWVQIIYNNVKQYDFRIGAGGSIDEFRDSINRNAPLLAPSTSTAPNTDRVAQLVTWDFDIKASNPPSNVADPRLNFDQAGTGTNKFSPLFSVQAQNAPGDCTVDIYSAIQDSWYPGLSHDMAALSTLYTHYEVSQGNILVRKILYLGSLNVTGVTGVTSQGTQNAYPALYLENWTPFNRPAFNSMALKVNASGVPTWWYNADDYPNYPMLPNQTTDGYAIVYKKNSPDTSTMIGVVYGNQPLQCAGGACQGESVFNSMLWDKGMGVLPAIKLTATPIGSTIDESFYIVPAHGLTAASADNISGLVQSVPPVMVYLPNATLPADTAQIKEHLLNIFALAQSGKGNRTKDLAPMTQFLNSPSSSN